MDDHLCPPLGQWSVDDVRPAVVHVSHHLADGAVVAVHLPDGGGQLEALAEVQVDAVVVPPVVVLLVEQVELGPVRSHDGALLHVQ